MTAHLVSHIIEGRHFVAVPEATKVREVARLMKEHRIGAVVVVDHDGKLVGVCAERDVVTGVVAAGRDAEQTSVEAVMTRHPQTVDPDAPFGRALHIMVEGVFRHVPVVDDSGRPLGLLCARDALRMNVLEFNKEAILPEDVPAIL